MAQIIIQTDEGAEVARYEFPASSAYALAYVPSCGINTRIHNLLMGLKRAISDACWIDENGRPRPPKLSEQAMALAAKRKEVEG